MRIDYDNDQLAYALANALKERDEAREKMADALQEVDLRMLDFERMKEERDKANEDLHKQLVQFDQLFDEAEKIRIERDEAREEIKEWKTLCLWGGTPEHIHGFIRGQQSRIQHLERERDEARESTLRIDAINFQLKKELSDAKTKIKSQSDRLRYLEGATNHACGTPLKIALRQRDQAVEEARLLKGILDLLKKEAQ